MRWIGGFKLTKGVLLLAMAAGAFRFLGHDPEQVLYRVVEHLMVDPQGRFFQALLSKVVQLSPKLPLLVTATVCYGAIFCTEGFGLLKRKRWAEWLTVIVTGSFLPIELYEMIKHRSTIKAVVIALNAAIVIYLVIRLKNRGRDHSRRESLTPRVPKQSGAT